MTEFENGAFHPRSAEAERNSGRHPLQAQSFTGSSQAVCLRQRLKQRDRTLILEGMKGLGSGVRAGYKGCRRDQAGFGLYGHLPMGKAEVALVQFKGRNI